MFLRIIKFALLVILICMINSNALSINKYLQFRLYTRENQIGYYVLTTNGISETPFNPNRQTRIFIHGFRSEEEIIRRYADAYMKLGDFNFIAVDWLKGASTWNYLAAKGRVGQVSYTCVIFIYSIVE